MEENARIKRRKKENKKIIRKQAKCRLMNRCTEILDNLLGSDKAKNILSCIELSQEIPTQISDEKEMQVSHLYNLKLKFHLKALSSIRDKGIFCGEALSHVDYTLHRLKTTIKTILRKIWKLKMKKWMKVRTQTMKMKKWRKMRTPTKSKYLGKVFY